MEVTKIHVLVIEKNPIISNRLISLIQGVPEVDKVIFADTFKKAYRILQNCKIHIVSLGIKVSDTNILELLAVCKYEQQCTLFILAEDLQDRYKLQYEYLEIKYWLDKARDFDMIPQLISQIANELNPAQKLI
ncbi:response regulator [Daejeonella oryzae]|uniref:hypothetical protein n=1 Tax=Daejeonella oryzae TaxID=1122943 RepID=UPI0012DCF5AC|nr:hypothetical protein [Daejeonella oryzae]